MTPRKHIYADYFSGGVPAGLYFDVQIDDLRNIVKEKTKIIPEICFIGLLAYTEAFFKEQFASLINICPDLLHELKKNNHTLNIDATALLALGDDLKNRIGCALAENYDFGTAKGINSIYQSLLTVSPFSQDEKDRFDQLLADRNLIVHHGGTYTIKYLQQKLGTSHPAVKDMAYHNSLEITPEKFLSAASFIEGIVSKTVQATQAALKTFVKKNNIELGSGQEKAVRALTWRL
jgi:hypothetical protein